MNTPHRFDWTAGYPSRRSPLFARNIVSTSHTLAAQAGLQMLRQGGKTRRTRWIVRPESGRNDGKNRAQPLIPAGFFACGAP